MFVDNSFIISGTSDKLQLNVSRDYVNYSTGVFAIKLVSIAIHISSTLRTVNVDKSQVLLLGNGLRELCADCVITLTCSACTGTYLTPPNQKAQRLESPLSQFRFKKSAGENFFSNINSDWYYVDNFDEGIISFSLKESIYDEVGLDIPHHISLHILLRRIRDAAPNK